MRKVETRDYLDAVLLAENKPYYVYVLRHPDFTPFYVGLGQRHRLFEHEKAARDGTEESPKIDKIRLIWSQGQEVVRTIDSFHSKEPWIREAELIHEIGRLADDTGTLTNPQTYAPSHIHEGVELRKYAGEQLVAGGVAAIPEKFKLRQTRLMAGPNIPKTISSVMGRLYMTAKENPGVTGEELVHLLSKLDFSKNKSPYTPSGKVCASWICRYIEGAYFRRGKLHLQNFEK